MPAWDGRITRAMRDTAARRLWPERFAPPAPPVGLSEAVRRLAEFAGAVSHGRDEGSIPHTLGEMLWLVGGVCWDASRRGDPDAALRALVVLGEWAAKEDAGRRAAA